VSFPLRAMRLLCDLESGRTGCRCNHIRIRCPNDGNDAPRGDPRFAYMRAQHRAGKTRPRLKARNSLIPLALFGLAFFGSFFAMRLARPVAAEPAQAPSIAQLPRVASASQPLQPQFPAASEPIEAAAPAAVSHQPPPTPPVVAPTVEEPPPVDPWPAEALQSFTAVEEVVQTLRHSANAAERINAIDQLAETARKGVEVSQVRASLRLAASDESPDVAARAQEEYEKLVEREDR
jgi:hypothetical protein